ncbi:hypothetical protein HDG38_001736 [Paraburkholderia sp. WSM4177]|nr:hypothetical protein [Paraburkholderia sp. WSM4177]MBB5483269.1 hypothetical protein [Paraburkholderia sp. WSM4180]
MERTGNISILFIAGFSPIVHNVEPSTAMPRERREHTHTRDPLEPAATKLTTDTKCGHPLTTRSDEFPEIY